MMSSYAQQTEKHLLLRMDAVSSVKHGFLSACAPLHPETQAEGISKVIPQLRGPFQTLTEQLFTSTQRALGMTFPKAVSRVNHIPKFPIYSPLLQ